MNNKKLLQIFSGLAVLGLIVLVWHGCQAFLDMRSGEFGKKDAFASLQSVEFAHRGDADKDSPIILKGLSDSGYDVLGLPTRDKTFPRAWLILNEKSHDSQVKILPEGVKFYVSCVYVSDLKSKIEMNHEVLIFLQKSCSKL